MIDRAITLEAARRSHRDDALFFGSGPVVAFEGRWYITYGNPGFNSPANNRLGYDTKGRALAAIRHYSRKS